ncbi:MAG: leucine-rich repeat domain-containing protein, partial [Bacteroidota bacterium]
MAKRNPDIPEDPETTRANLLLLLFSVEPTSRRLGMELLRDPEIIQDMLEELMVLSEYEPDKALRDRYRLRFRKHAPPALVELSKEYGLDGTTNDYLIERWLQALVAYMDLDPDRLFAALKHFFPHWDRKLPRLARAARRDLLFRLQEEKAHYASLGKGGYLPPIVREQKDLRDLGWGFRDLPKLPDVVFEFPELESLRFHQCSITVVDPRITKLRKLVSLSVANDELRELPMALLCRKGFHSLDVHRNQLRSLPKEIGKAKSLRRLNLSGNEIRTLPDSFVQLGALQELHLDLPSGMIWQREMGFLARLPKLKCLVVTNNRLGGAPLIWLRENL